MDNLARVNRLLFDWADYVKAGRTCQGVFQTSSWPSGRPVEAGIRRKQRNTLAPVPNPKETRITRPKIPCMRVAYREEKVHKIIMTLPDYVKPIICCLYLMRLGYGDTAVILGLKSKQVVRIKRKSLKVIYSLL